MNSTEKHIEVWSNCLRIISHLVEEPQYSKWFKPIRAVSLVDSTLTLEVPSDFFREYIESAYLDVLSKTLRREIGAGARLMYTIRPVQGEREMTFPATNGNTPVNREVDLKSFQSGATPSHFVYPGLHRVKINPRLNSVYCFENLVTGNCNKMALTAGESISASPGRTPFNPLFIYGGSGLGKTHIAQAIGIAVNRKFPDLVVLYVTGNEFKTQYMDATTVRNKLVDFLAYYMRIDVLIVDDIQDLVGQGSQGAFFNIFNHLHQNGKQLIFTSDRSPVELQNFEERLRSRFKWGLNVELGRPDYETRLKMLSERKKREGMEIDDEVLEYIATNVKTNFRELEGALISVAAHTAVYRDVPQLELAKKLTSQIAGQVKDEISINFIQERVCEYFNITKDALISSSRKRNIVQARQIAMYLCRSIISNCSLSAIGAELGGKDHATVLHACNTVSDLMSTDKSFKRYVTDLKQIISPID